MSESLLSGLDRFFEGLGCYTVVKNVSHLVT
jgi:hypothetical protein